MSENGGFAYMSGGFTDIGTAGLSSRVETLENDYVYFEVFESITAATTTAAFPTNSELLLDRYGPDENAVIAKLNANGRPEYESVYTANGSPVIVDLDSNGNITITGTPTEWPVALVYQIQIPRKNTGNVPVSSIVNFVDLQDTDDIVNISDVDGKNLTTVLNNLITTSTGCIDKPSITKEADGSITLGNMKCAFVADTDYKGTLYQHTFASDNYILTDNSINYIVANYNSGSPIVEVYTSVSAIQQSNIIPIVTVNREGTRLDVLDWDELANLLANKLSHRLVKVDRFKRSSGLSISVNTLNINVTAGEVWYGASSQALAECDSTTCLTNLRYHSSGSWAKSAITQINNTQYDDGTNLQTLSNNKFAVNWVYIVVDTTTPKMEILLGNGDYTLEEAQKALIPSLPDNLHPVCILVGKVIIEKNATTPYSVESAFTNEFNTGGVNDHADLTGRDTAEQHPSSSITDTSLGVDTVAEVLSLIEENYNDSRSNIGFLYDDYSKISVTANASTRVVTLTTTDDIYAGYRGKQIAISTGTLTVTVPDTAGNHWVYLDTDGTLKTTMSSAQIIRNNILVAFVYVQADGTLLMAASGFECHGLEMPGMTHLWLHDKIGATVSGFIPTDLVGRGSTSDDASAQLGFTSGYIIDEDLRFSVSAKGSTTDWWNLWLEGTNGVGDGIKWKSHKNDFPMIYSGDGSGYTGANSRIAYNNVTASAASLDEVTEGDYTYLIVGIGTLGTTDVVNNQDPVDIMFTICGQELYTSRTAARAGLDSYVDRLELADLPLAEARLLTGHILRTDKDWTNTPKCYFEYFEYVDADDNVYVDLSEKSIAGSGNNTGIDWTPIIEELVGTRTTENVTTNKTLSADDRNITQLCNISTGTITLPTPSAALDGYLFHVTNINATALTISGVEGLTELAQYESASFQVNNDKSKVYCIGTYTAGGAESNITETLNITTSIASASFTDSDNFDDDGHIAQFEGLVEIDNSAALEFELSDDAGSTWITSLDYDTRNDRTRTNDSALTIRNRVNQDHGDLTDEAFNASHPLWFRLQLINYQSGFNTIWRVDAVGRAGTNQAYRMFGTGILKNTTAKITGVKIQLVSPTFNFDDGLIVVRNIKIDE